MKRVREFFQAISDVDADIKSASEQIWFNLLPKTAQTKPDIPDPPFLGIDYLRRWIEQFGIVLPKGAEEADIRERVAGIWKAEGSLSPPYLEAILHGQGFRDLAVYDWFDSAGKTRIPTNEIITGPPPTVDTRTKGYLLFDGYTWNKPITTNPNQYENFIYIGSKTGLGMSRVVPGREDELNQLLLKYAPAHLNIGVKVYFSKV